MTGGTRPRFIMVTEMIAVFFLDPVRHCVSYGQRNVLTMFGSIHINPAIINILNSLWLTVNGMRDKRLSQLQPQMLLFQTSGSHSN